MGLQCQRLHVLTGQVSVAVRTVTFEFPGLCMEFQLHNTTITWIFSPLSRLPSWHLFYYYYHYYYFIPVNESYSSLPSLLFLGQTALLPPFPPRAPPECQAGDQLGPWPVRVLLLSLVKAPSLGEPPGEASGMDSGVFQGGSRCHALTSPQGTLRGSGLICVCMALCARSSPPGC